MKKLFLLLLFLATIVDLSGCSIITDKSGKYLKLQHEEYRIGGAHRAFIGSIGLVRKESDNIYEIKYQPKWENLLIAKTTEFKADIAKKYNLDSNATANINEVGNITASGTIDAKSKEEGIFHVFQITDIKNLVEQLNRTDNKDLIGYIQRDKDFRIITGMIVVYGHDRTKELNAKGNANFSLSSISGAPEIKVSGGTGSDVKLKYSDGTIYAYEYARFCWRKNNNKIIVDDILVDRPTLFGDAHCLTGAFPDPQQLNN